MPSPQRRVRRRRPPNSQCFRGDDAARVVELEARNKALEQDLREVRRANEIVRKAAAYFAQAELDRPSR